VSNLNWVGDIPIRVALVLAALLSALSLWLYRRQLRKSDIGCRGWIIAGLRSMAIAMVVLTLAEPVIEMRTREGELARVTFLIDASRSMSVTEPALDTATGFKQATKTADRFTRAAELLWRDGGILAALQDDFDMRVVRFDQQLGGELWSTRSGPAVGTLDMAYDWAPTAWSEATGLGDVLLDSISSTEFKPEVDEAARAASARGETLVLLSDGRHNYGRDPLSVTEQLARAGVKIFTIGFGRQPATSELMLQQFVLPERVVRSDTLRGSIILSQRLATGTRFTIQIEQAGKSVWQQTAIANDETQRDMGFALPVEELYQRALQEYPQGTEITHLPLKLTARLSVEGAMHSPSHNSLDGYSLIAAHKSRLLIVDGRNRWETRYLKNAFARDPNWQVDTLIQSNMSVTGLTGGDSVGSIAKGLPTTVEELSSYDLVILGEAEAPLTPDLFWAALRDWVELAGGGLIIIDGARESLRAPQLEILQRLSPVTWQPLPRNMSATVRRNQGSSQRSLLKLRPQLTAVGQRMEALRLDTELETVSPPRLWSALPELEYVSRVQPLPGAEVWMEAVNEIDQTPLLITRRYGAGRVLFSASDETWRWRYEVAEQVHSRLWLQLAHGIKKSPLSLRNEFVSLDTGAASYATDQAIWLRCELRQADGSPAAGLPATAQITAGGRVVTTLALGEDALPGRYSAELKGLPEGDYQVSIAAPNFTAQALALRSQFSVVAPPSQEMRELSCNVDLLQAIADRSGGEYLTEASAMDLVELLQPQVRGRIRTSALLLWQSFGWFAAIMLLLVAEWILRKRWGLV
jgi:uncharacterized membrane protein